MSQEKAARAEELRKRAEQFRLEEAPDFASEIERTQRIPDSLWKRIVELELNRLTLPEWAGGFGLSVEQYFPILEEIARCHGSIRMVVHAYNSLWRPVAQGREEQQREWLPKVAAGEALIGFALTEPGNGTGIDLQTSAVNENESYVLNGTKHLITFAEEASVLVVIAKTDPEAGRQGLTAFLVRKGTPGLTLQPMPEMMGDKGCSHAIVVFQDCRVSEADVLGEVGQGFEVALRGFLDQSRACIAQSGVGVAQQSLEEAVKYVRQRTTFGKPLSSRQAVQMRIAEMATAVQAARLLCREAARKFDAGQDIAMDASMAKGFAIKMLREVTDGALQLFGGIGYAVGSPVERLYRDARSLWFEEGTIEMQNMTIAEAVFAEARRRDRSLVNREA